MLYIKLTKAWCKYRCTLWFFLTKQVSKNANFPKRKLKWLKTLKIGHTILPLSALWFPRCHFVLHHLEFFVFLASHLHPHHLEEEALHLQVLGWDGVEGKSQIINLSNYVLRPLSSLYNGPIKIICHNVQNQPCWALGDADVRNTSLITHWVPLRHLCWVSLRTTALWPSTKCSTSSR